MVGGERTEPAASSHRPSLPARPHAVQGEPVSPRRREYFTRFGDGEHSGLAKHVARTGQVFPRHGREHVLHHESDVLRPARTELGWDLMGTEKRRHQSQAFRLRQALNDAQLLELGLELEPVTRFHLDRREPCTQREQSRA
jgi:hypothetical protein